MQNVPYSWVEKLFANWTMMYGNRMDKMWNGMDKGQVIMFWHLKLEGLTREEFTRGVKASERLEYPPTLPQFLNLCRPPIDKTKAYYEAVKGVQERRFGRKGEWSHPAIFWTAASMSFDLLNMSHQQVKSRFEKALDAELQKTAWPEIPEACTALPPPKVDREKAKAESALKRIGAANAVPGSRGNTDWIDHGLERIRNGEKMTVAVRNCILNGAKAAGIPISQQETSV